MRKLGTRRKNYTSSCSACVNRCCVTESWSVNHQNSLRNGVPPEKHFIYPEIGIRWKRSIYSLATRLKLTWGTEKCGPRLDTGEGLTEGKLRHRRIMVPKKCSSLGGGGEHRQGWGKVVRYPGCQLRKTFTAIRPFKRRRVGLITETLVGLW